MQHSQQTKLRRGGPTVQLGVAAHADVIKGSNNKYSCPAYRSACKLLLSQCCHVGLMHDKWLVLVHHGMLVDEVHEQLPSPQGCSLRGSGPRCYSFVFA
jgi:hypothetical protein